MSLVIADAVFSNPDAIDPTSPGNYWHSIEEIAGPEMNLKELDYPGVGMGAIFLNAKKRRITGTVIIIQDSYADVAAQVDSIQTSLQSPPFDVTLPSGQMHENCWGDPAGAFKRGIIRKMDLNSGTYFSLCGFSIMVPL